MWSLLRLSFAKAVSLSLVLIIMLFQPGQHICLKSPSYCIICRISAKWRTELPVIPLQNSPVKDGWVFQTAFSNGSISGVLALQYSVNLTQISGTDVMEKLPLGDTWNRGGNNVPSSTSCGCCFLCFLMGLECSSIHQVIEYFGIVSFQYLIFHFAWSD